MPPLKAQLLLAESLAAYFPEMVFTDSGITVQLHRNTQKAVKEAHGYLDEAISRVQERALKALGGVLDAFVAIVEAPQDQELKDAARSGLESIGTSGAWAKLADRVVNVLMPSARAAQAADGIDWPKEVKETGRKLRDRTVDSSSDMGM